MEQCSIEVTSVNSVKSSASKIQAPVQNKLNNTVAYLLLRKILKVRAQCGMKVYRSCTRINGTFNTQNLIFNLLLKDFIRRKAGTSLV